MKKFLFSVFAFGIATSVLAKNQVMTVKFIEWELYSETSYLVTTDKGKLLFDYSLGEKNIEKIISMADKKQCAEILVKNVLNDDGDTYITKADIKRVKCTK